MEAFYPMGGASQLAMLSLWDPPQPFIDLTSDDESEDVEMIDAASTVVVADPEETEDEEEDQGAIDQCEWCNCALGVDGAHGSVESRDGVCVYWVCQACFEEARGDVVA